MCLNVVKSIFPKTSYYRFLNLEFSVEVRGRRRLSEITDVGLRGEVDSPFPRLAEESNREPESLIYINVAKKHQRTILQGSTTLEP